jgi:Ca-activated chloride channel family protein
MRRVSYLLVLAALGASLGGCSRANKSGEGAPAAAGFTVLAGSELKDVETQLKSDIRAGTGLDLVFTYSGTLDAIDRIANGDRRRKRRCFRR